ncbi:MAG: hypothetical protein WAM60_07645 [Candidatus Promineifilaceae bacterium]
MQKNDGRPIAVFFSILILILFLAACADNQAEKPTPSPDEIALNTNTAETTAYPVIITTPTAPDGVSPTSAVPDINEPYPAEATPTFQFAPNTPAVAGTAVSPGDKNIFLPFFPGLPANTPTATPQPTNTPMPTPTPTIDFAAVRQGLQAQGNDLGFVKIGFHLSVGGNINGLDTWMQRLDAAGVPFFLKSADNAGPIFEAQELAKKSGVPHTLVYRRSGQEYDVPDYSLSPQEAARKHWDAHIAVFPPELDPSMVWLETINEVDKNQAEWLGQFALATAEMALADGYKWAAFGWASGEPEVETWEAPSMLAFLRLAAAHPDQLAIAVHEYSFLTTDIADQYPYKVGRFQQLFQLCDQYGIPRPTVLITEWGWAYQDVPSVSAALDDIAWAAHLYAQYPQVKGAAIWHLGCCFADVADQTQRLIQPLTEYALGNYFAIPLPPDQAPIDPEAYRP